MIMSYSKHRDTRCCSISTQYRLDNNYHRFNSGTLEGMRPRRFAGMLARCCERIGVLLLSMGVARHNQQPTKLVGTNEAARRMGAGVLVTIKYWPPLPRDATMHRDSQEIHLLLSCFHGGHQGPLFGINDGTPWLGQ